MLLLVAKWLVLWIAYMFVFMAAGAVIGIVAIEIDLGLTRTSGMAALGFWAMPMLLFWALCVIAGVGVIAKDCSFLTVLNALAIFLPGMGLGSAAVFMAGPLWGSWRAHL